jgi:hypothetical protein
LNIKERIYDLLRSRQTAFQQTFKKNDVAADAVLKDLEKFCKANESTFNPDPRIHALLEGRREVYLRIKDYTTLTPDELFTKYNNSKGD